MLFKVVNIVASLCDKPGTEQNIPGYIFIFIMIMHVIVTGLSIDLLIILYIFTWYEISVKLNNYP